MGHSPSSFTSLFTFSCSVPLFVILQPTDSSFVMFSDKRYVTPRLSLTNTAALNYLLRSEIFVSEDGQLRSVPLILGYTPKTELQPRGNAITAGDRRINRIDVARKTFLAPFDLVPVPHPNPQGIPVLVQPVQRAPFEPAAEERIASSTPSLDAQIDRFKFEEDTSEEVQILSSEEAPDRQSAAPVLNLALPEDSAEEDMLPLGQLMKNRKTTTAAKGTGTSQPQVNLPPPPPPPQAPKDLSLKVLPDLKKKRVVTDVTDVEEGEVVPPKGHKQQKKTHDTRSKRASSTESREENVAADVRRGTQLWSPKLTLDGAAIPLDASLRNYAGGKAEYIAEALERPLLLPKDMESYRRFSEKELFLSLKRDLGMVRQLVPFCSLFCSPCVFIFFL